MTREVFIKAAHGGRIDVNAGERLEVINVQGQQICDFFAFRKDDLHIFLSPAQTRAAHRRWRIGLGDLLYDETREAVFEIVEDTVGRHDCMFCCCDVYRYTKTYDNPGGRVEVKAGQLLEIVNEEGGQVLDLYVFAAGDHQIWSSPSHTRVMNDSYLLRVGHHIWSVKRDPLFEILHDDVGVHDLSLASCDKHRMTKLYELPDHRSCRSNLAETVADFGIRYEWLPHPINIFQNTPIQMDGTYADYQPSPAKPGDKIVLAALVDLVAVGSACPFDLLPLNGDRLSDILFVVLDR